MFNGYVREQKKQQHSTPSDHSLTLKLSRFQLYNHIDKEGGKGTFDELDRFLNADIETEVENPLLWWKAHEAQYPLLSRIAFDLFAAPATSAECERVFSRAGRVLDSRRLRTYEEIGEATECLRAWLRAGLIKL